MKKVLKLCAGVAALGMLAGFGGCGLIGGGDTTDVFSLKVGDCVDVSGLGDLVSKLPTMACTEPHNGEIYYIFNLPDGTFDEDANWDATVEECMRTIDEYVGPNWDQVSSQGLEPGAITPVAETWAKGDREVICYVGTVSGDMELTSSVKGLGR